MGEVKKLFCELCKAEITPPTFSAPDDSGEVHYRLEVIRDANNTETFEGGEICETCHGKVASWFLTKQKAAATAWKTDVPATSTVKLPTV
jgi:hypothetical protein